MARSVALSFAVLLAVFHVGSCLRCYQCTSESSRDCIDPYKSPNNHLADCSNSKIFNSNNLRFLFQDKALEGVPGAPQACVKIVTQSGSVVRTCTDSNPQVPGEICRALKTDVKYCKSCESDSCNGAGSITASLPVALGALVLSYLYFKQ